MSQRTNEELQQEIWRWNRQRQLLVAERDRLQEKILDVDRVLDQLYKK